MRFQERDSAILLTIYEYGGVLALRHLKGLFWPHTTLRAMQKRLAKLAENSYLDRPTAYQRKTQPIPEPICWLAWKGIIWVAGQNNVVLDRPANGRGQGGSECKRPRLRSVMAERGAATGRPPPPRARPRARPFSLAAAAG